ncbi:anthranilate synthase component I family protein [Streptomyces sp. ISL-98]|uniref:anthranilate synthase component I family protein n=1 Tax=Streptomyces sp. ISL-98 TaxID=2819192 RepID=UPI001BE7C82D|nr:anthranilate synthase component I family protein [Streptomyces sp. ISL-98]MBT2510076.1 anthranilate synthase component I family protein [Streptomyces sp. ISL-98]
MTVTAPAPAPAPAATLMRVRVARDELPPHEPLALYADLRERLGSDQVFLFESLAGPDQDCRAAVVGADVLARITVRDGRVSFDGLPELMRHLEAVAAQHPDVWELLRAVDASFAVESEVGPGTYAFGFLATFGYEAAWYMEELPPRRPGAAPEITLTAFRHTVWYDVPGGGARHLRAEAAEFGGSGPLGSGLDVLVRGLPARRYTAVPTAPRPRAVRRTVGRKTFAQRVKRCLAHIRAGDVYQIQIGHRIEVRTPLGVLDAYRRLRHRNPSPYMYLAPWAGRTLIGASPELLFRIEDGRLTMRPIAGTAARSSDPAEDARRVEALRASEKERAEHVMLVDLCRNDVARVTRPGTLSVDSMMSVEAFSHVHHLVSTVGGELAEGEDVWSALRAVFPAGTMTGAPKLRAMELIDEIERQPRGAYAGAIGLIDVRGFAVLALCIRTAVHEGDTYALQASAGIVADSSADGEWCETLIKMSAVYGAVTGEELTA